MHLQEALVACQWREREGLVQGETPLGPGEPGPEVQVLSRSQGKPLVLVEDRPYLLNVLARAKGEVLEIPG